ncbi:hypothetical protein QEH59_13595 [Coraliomargarita sp. SDUM461004]|uniref:Uncharacterized protein n=1 Tax=Thalassobacterium sedimentorum TaxID=3041258 RepID=A0ABU1AL39_9BACT|nr:hypothetical protein [Coraliomargarita sp. SDUM461004]MDQ8195464.1 hypothetical protein [Coraliomargarita sp. SDUM461004]
MAAGTITESGMDFGPFADGDVFQLETSAVYKNIQEGVQMAEFVVVENGSVVRLVTLEAKTSSPRAENEPDFSSYIEAVSSKLMNGFHLAHAIRLGRHHKVGEVLPLGFHAIDFGTCEHRLLLVIKNAQKEWLPPIQDALRIALRGHVKLWNLGPRSVLVLNEEGARKNGFIKGLGSEDA